MGWYQRRVHGEIEQVSQARVLNDDRQADPGLVPCHPLHGKMSGHTLFLQKRRNQVL